MSTHKKNTAGLIQAAENKSLKTLAKVTEVIEHMQRQDLPINYNSVAKLAGVSKTWLYNRAEVSEQIKTLRTANTSKVLQHDVLQNKYEKIKLENEALLSKNVRLRDQVRSLKKQLEIVYGELYKAKQKLQYIE